jgi:hypothetical protein
VFLQVVAFAGDVADDFHAGGQSAPWQLYAEPSLVFSVVVYNAGAHAANAAGCFSAPGFSCGRPVALPGASGLIVEWLAWSSLFLLQIRRFWMAAFSADRLDKSMNSAFFAEHRHFYPPMLRSLTG